MDTESVQGEPMDINHARYLVGEALFDRGHFDQALIAFREAFRADTSDPMALMAMANSASELGQPRRARRYLLMALRLHPDDRDLHYNLGNALFDMRQYAAAIEAYERLMGADDEIAALAEKNRSVAMGRSQGGGGCSGFAWRAAAQSPALRALS